MKKNATHIITIFSLTILISCGGQTENNIPAKQETPQALQDNKLEIKSYSRSSYDLSEELYQELVDKAPVLKKLEEDLGTYEPYLNKTEGTFSKYDSKSNSYYSSLNYKVSGITDSLLRNRIIALITKSKNNYSNKTAEINSLLKQISQNGVTLNDHHSVLKIVLTLPIIEKYQNENLPDKKEFKTLIIEQAKLIERTDSLTPIY